VGALTSNAAHSEIHVTIARQHDTGASSPASHVWNEFRVDITYASYLHHQHTESFLYAARTL
jgi:hypothetical protein